MNFIVFERFWRSISHNFGDQPLESLQEHLALFGGDPPRGMAGGDQAPHEFHVFHVFIFMLPFFKSPCTSPIRASSQTVNDFWHWQSAYDQPLRLYGRGHDDLSSLGLHNHTRAQQTNPTYARRLPTLSSTVEPVTGPRPCSYVLRFSLATLRQEFRVLVLYRIPLGFVCCCRRLSTSIGP